MYQMQNTINIPPSAANNLTLVVCYDNYPYKKGLTTAWGFSCLIRGSEKSILFDTGGDDSILRQNLKTLGISPDEIKVIVLSHIHGDHVGGLHGILEKRSNAIAYLPESFPRSFIEAVETYGAKAVNVRESVEICANIYSSGELGTEIKEQSLILKTAKGLIIITGCAHPGVVKIVRTVKENFKDEVLLVLGGFHLAGQTKEEIAKIVAAFRKLGVRHVAPCHCSGDLARALFLKEYGDDYINTGVGKAITFDALK